MTTPKKMREAPFPKELVKVILENAGDKIILVGGQALSFWIDYFELNWSSGFPFVSRDIDFLTQSSVDSYVVNKFSNVIHGSSYFPSIHALTALVGQSVKEISDDEYLNIDILHKVLSGTEGVRLRAVSLLFNGKPLRVMHPFDVLASRLINIYKLKDKQTTLGAEQLKSAIEVSRCELHRVFDSGENIRPAFQFLVALAKSDAGKKISKRWGIHVADAIDPMIRASEPDFLSIELPNILSLMSDDAKEEFNRELNRLGESERQK